MFKSGFKSCLRKALTGCDCDGECQCDAHVGKSFDYSEKAVEERKDSIGRRYCVDVNEGKAKRVKCEPKEAEAKEAKSPAKPAAKAPEPEAKSVALDEMSVEQLTALKSELEGKLAKVQAALEKKAPKERREAETRATPKTSSAPAAKPKPVNLDDGEETDEQAETRVAETFAARDAANAKREAEGKKKAAAALANVRSLDQLKDSAFIRDFVDRHEGHQIETAQVAEKVKELASKLTTAQVQALSPKIRKSGRAASIKEIAEGFVQRVGSYARSQV